MPDTNDPQSSPARPAPAAIYAPIRLGIRSTEIQSVRVVDTDLVILTRTGRRLTIRDGAIRAVMEPQFVISFVDGDATGGALFRQADDSAPQTLNLVTVGPVVADGPGDDRGATAPAGSGDAPLTDSAAGTAPAPIASEASASSSAGAGLAPALPSTPILPGGPGPEAGTLSTRTAEADAGSAANAGEGLQVSTPVASLAGLGLLAALAAGGGGGGGGAAAAAASSGSGNSVSVLANFSIFAGNFTAAVRVDVYDSGGNRVGGGLSDATGHFSGNLSSQIVTLGTNAIGLGAAALGVLGSSVGLLGTTAIASLSSAAIAALASDQVAALGTRIGMVSGPNLAALSDAGAGALSAPQIAALPATTISWLGSSQLAALGTGAAGLSSTDIATLGSKLGVLSTLALAQLGASAIGGLTASQIELLGNGIAALATDTQQCNLPRAHRGKGAGRKPRDARAGQGHQIAAQTGDLAVAQLSGSLARERTQGGRAQAAHAQAQRTDFEIVESGGVGGQQGDLIGGEGGQGVDAQALDGATGQGAYSRAHRQHLRRGQHRGGSGCQGGDRTGGEGTIAAIPTEDIACISTYQLAAMTHYQGLSWTSAQKAAMNADQLQVLGMPLGLPGTGDVAALSTTDVAALGTDIGTLGSDAAAALGTDQISALSSAQVALLSSSAVAVLSLAQVQALGSNLGALSVSALGAIAPDRIAGLGTDQITSLGISSASPANRAFVGMSFQPGAGLSVESDIRSLMARREASDRDLAASQLDLLEEFNTDWLGFNAVRERLDAVLDALGDTRAISRSYERQYQAGRKSWLDVMNLLREQLQLELQQVDLESSLIALSRKLQVRAAGLAAWGSE